MLRAALAAGLLVLSLSACVSPEPPRGPPPPSAPDRARVTPPPPPIDAIRPRI
ncbi:hypothetical protein [Caulobacter sp. B11]|uniref:hypothetical protein n=1 Tax=Caulobacter sp. B11 TaxID=2048899 RepID=UPI00137472DA|nr:hypothetical protein [Caulobacter sp. B11]